MSEDVTAKWSLEKKIGVGLGMVIFLIVVFLILSYKYDWWPFDDDPSCIRPSPTIGYDLTGVTDTDLSISNFTVAGVVCDTGYSGAAAATACDTAGVPYTLGGCTATPPPVVGNCVSFDCSGQTNSLSGNPGSIRCSGDPCTATECCTVTPPPVVGNCVGFTCTDGTLTGTPPTCAADPCTQLECCDATVTEPATHGPVAPSCTLPAQAETGYVYGDNKAVTGTGTTGITCDATNGWHSDASGSIVASCDTTTSLYSLSGCTRGCAKPVPGTVPGYNLTAVPAFLAYGTDSRNISGLCSVGGTGPVLGSCVDDEDLTNIDYYTVTGCEDAVSVANVQEWYIGVRGENCDTACSAQGKTCSPEDWGVTFDNLPESVALAGSTCEGQQNGTGSGAPGYLDRHGVCKFSTIDQDCASSVSSGRRLCKCIE